MPEENQSVPHVLCARNWTLLQMLHHSRPRELARIISGLPGVESTDGSFAPLKTEKRFDILLVGHLVNPIAKPVPEQTPFNDDLIDKVPKRVLFVHDAQRRAFRGGHRALQKFINRHFQYIIMTYCRSREAEKILAGCKDVRGVYELGQHIDTNVFRDYGLKKELDVLLFGQTNPIDYPFRHRLAELLPRSGLKTRVVPHPAETGNLSAPRDEGLSRLINQSWISVATPSRYKYMLAKYFEIAASRTVVAGKIPKKDRPLWRHHYVRLDESMADEEIIRRLKDALADKDELRRMADAMYEPVRTRFGYPQYRDKIVSIIDAVHRDSLVQ